jgi:hypothetical protein
MQIQTIVVQMKFHIPRSNQQPTAADIVGSVVLVGLLVLTFWILLRMIPYHDIPIWML